MPSLLELELAAVKADLALQRTIAANAGKLAAEQKDKLDELEKIVPSFHFDCPRKLVLR